MISRRGLFRLLTGAVASPVLKPLAALIPVEEVSVQRHYYTLFKHDDLVQQSEYPFYDPAFLANLRANTPMTPWSKTYLPLRSGKTIKFFTYKLPQDQIETV